MDTKIVAFDFDGTITRKDTFFAFLIHTKGYWKTYFGLLLFSPIILLYKLRVLSNGKAKEIVFSFFFKGMSLSVFNGHCRSFTSKIDEITRSEILRSIRNYQKENCTIIIISASIQNWINPWSKTIAINQVIATKIDIDKNEKLTGKFSTPNCYGKEKVNRLLAHFPNRKQYKLIVYGNSKGDYELIKTADEGYLL